MDTAQIGKRAWSYAGVLQQAGLSCVEYVEQLTMLLFLKMADQLTGEPWNQPAIVPEQYGWRPLLKLSGAELEKQYSDAIEALGKMKGMLGVIFKGARCDIHNPALLQQLIVNLIDKEDWMSLPVDVKGTIYEELLQRSASESTNGVKANVLFFDKKEGRPKPWTEKLWGYDLRTNKHFTQKQSPVTRRDFDEFIALYRAGEIHKRKPTWSEKTPEGRWRSYSYDEILKRDKLSLDLFWIKDQSLTDTDSLPAPDILATEIADELEAAFDLFTKIAKKLPKSAVKTL